MNMAGKIRDKNETMDMDQLFSSGYIIELETGKYLSGYNKKSIRSSPLERAIRFRSKQQAAECILLKWERPIRFKYGAVQRIGESRKNIGSRR